MLFNQGLQSILLHKRFQPIVCYSQCTPAHAAFFGVMMSAGRSYVALHSINEHLLPKLQYFGLWPLMPKAKNKESYAGMPYSMATFQGLNKKTRQIARGKSTNYVFFLNRASARMQSNTAAVVATSKQGLSRVFDLEINLGF